MRSLVCDVFSQNPICVGKDLSCRWCTYFVTVRRCGCDNKHLIVCSPAHARRGVCCVPPDFRPCILTVVCYWYSSARAGLTVEASRQLRTRNIGVAHAQSLLRLVWYVAQSGVTNQATRTSRFWLVVGRQSMSSFHPGYHRDGSKVMSGGWRSSCTRSFW